MYGFLVGNKRNQHYKDTHHVSLRNSLQKDESVDVFVESNWQVDTGGSKDCCELLSSGC